MTLWHFFGAFLVLGLVNWAAACRGIGRTWWAVAAAIAPLAGVLGWIGLWVRMDWERSLLDQAAWIVAGHVALLLMLGGVAVITWRSATGHHPASARRTGRRPAPHEGASALRTVNTDVDGPGVASG